MKMVVNHWHWNVQEFVDSFAKLTCFESSRAANSDNTIGMTRRSCFHLKLYLRDSAWAEVEDVVPIVAL